MSPLVRPIESYEIPKPSGGTRRMARLHPPDASAWAALGQEAAPAIEAALGPEVLANRVDPNTGRPLGLRPSLREARRRARALASAGPMLRADVTACYPSIDGGSIHEALAAFGLAERARAAAAMVEGWSSLGYAGLPIGPEPSALFANAVLAPVDRALRRAGLRFLRWVDDYLIVAGRQADRPAERLEEALARAGLALHPAKTYIDEDRRSPWPGAAYPARNG